MLKRFLPIFFLITLMLPLSADEVSTELETELIAAEESPPVEAETPDQESPPVEAETPAQETQDVHAATESYESAFVKTLFVLVGLLVLIVLTVWMFKRISRGRIKSVNYLKSIKILEKRPISPKSMLYLIEVAGKQILIAESQIEVKTLTTLEWSSKEKEL